MQHHTKLEREEIQRRDKTYLVIYFRDGGSEQPVIERLSSEEVKYLKDTRPITFKHACVLKGEVYKGFNSDFWGMIK